MLHPGTALLSPANPKFNFLSGGSQEQHINESSTLHSYDPWEQPNILLITLAHLPARLVCFKCSRKAALSTALEVTGSRGKRTGRLKKTLCHVSLGRVTFQMWRAVWLPKPDFIESALGEHSCPAAGAPKGLTLLPNLGLQTPVWLCRCRGDIYDLPGDPFGYVSLMFSVW